MPQNWALHGGSTTRRQFLRRSAVTAAGLTWGMPALVPGAALGCGRTAPSQRVTLGFIGLGWKGFEGCWGSLLQTFIADRSCQVRAVSDVGVTLHHTGYDVNEGVTFFGTTGRVNLMAISGRAVFEPVELGRQCRDLETQSHDLLGNKGHYENFLDCVRTRQTPTADVEIGCRSVTVCHLANIAHALHRPLRWDPVREEFPDDAEANRCLARAQREPWQI